MSSDSQGTELVIIGKGLGFKAKVGQPVNQTLVEKIFRTDTHTQASKLAELLAEIPPDHISLVCDLIEIAKNRLKSPLNKSIYLTLTDHISYAIERIQQGQIIKNMQLWEMKHFYPDEYEIGQLALTMIQDKLKVALPEDEAGFIAYHLVNAQGVEQQNQTEEMTRIIQNCLDIVRSYYSNHVINEETLTFQHFINHLKLLARAVLQKMPLEDGADELFNHLKSQYKDECTCTEKIKTYLTQDYQVVLTEAEMTYLILHIKKITQNDTIKN